MDESHILQLDWPQSAQIKLPVADKLEYVD